MDRNPSGTCQEPITRFWRFYHRRGVTTNNTYETLILKGKTDKAFQFAMNHKGEFPAVLGATLLQATGLVKRLLSNGWEPDGSDPNYNNLTPLHFAIKMGHNDIFKHLMWHNAKISLAGEAPPDNAHIMDYLVRTGRRRDLIVTWVISGMGEEEAQRKVEGRTILHRMAGALLPLNYAFFANSPKYPILSWCHWCCLLEEFPIDLNSKADGHGYNFVMTLIRNPHVSDKKIAKIIWYALSPKSFRDALDPNQVDHELNSILHHAVDTKRRELLRWLSGRPEIEVGGQTRVGQTAMFLAAKKGDTESMDILYSMGESTTTRGHVTYYSGLRDVPSIINNRYEKKKRVRDRRNNLKLTLIHLNLGKPKFGNGEVKSLAQMCKERIRATVGEDGRNIKPKIKELELPKPTKDWLLRFD